MKKYLLIFIKGFIIGMLMVVPGISGGTLALIFGVYSGLIEAISGLFKDFKHNAALLLSFIIGALPGFYVTSTLMSSILEEYSVILVFLFAGLIIAGLPVVIKKAKISKFNWKHLLAIILGAGAIIGITFIPETNVNIMGGGAIGITDILYLLLVGFVCCLSILLPGISTFHMLYVFGLYEDVTTAIANLDILFLLPIGISMIIGLLVLSKAVSYFLKKAPTTVYCVIIGFVVASVAVMFKKVPTGIEWLWSIILLLVGLVGGYFIFNRTKIADNPD